MVKIVSVPRINALGKIGPEKMSEAVLGEVGLDFEKISVDNENIAKDERIVFEGARKVFSKGEVACFVGGDHSITYPIFSAFVEKNKEPFLIVFDAHADCMPAMKEPTHEEFLRGVIEENFVEPENVVLIGVRKIEKEEGVFLREKGIKVFGEIYDVEAVADYVTEKAMGKDVYVSVDIDVLDPAFAPGVNYSEPNGLSSKELFYLLKRVFAIRGMKCLDVVEVCVDKDEKYDFRTVKVAAKIVSDFVRVS
jgi:agmatinase